jgi:hypothetical protein
MVRIRKERGGSGIGPHWWPEDDPVCDVPEELARVLLGRPEEEGYSLEPEAPGGEGSPEDDGDPAAEPEPETPEGDGSSESADPEPPAKPSRPRSRKAAS